MNLINIVKNAGNIFAVGAVAYVVAANASSAYDFQSYQDQLKRTPGSNGHHAEGAIYASKHLRDTSKLPRRLLSLLSRREAAHFIRNKNFS